MKNKRMFLINLIMARLHLFYFLALAVLTPNEGAKNCDRLGTLIYQDLGCTPIYENLNDCPKEYTCNFERVNGTCLFRNRYIPVGQFLPDDLVENTCQIGCYCQEDGTFICAIIDCYEYFYPPPPGCYNTYDLEHCCSTGLNCPSDNGTVLKCVVKGRKFLEGQRFEEDHTCNRCICTDGYIGDGKPECQPINCASQLQYPKEIANKCAPVYVNPGCKYCCPSYWLCPSSDQEIVPLNQNHESDLKCQFGDELYNYGHRFEIGWDTTKLKCECRLPPLLTCTN